MFSRHLKVRRMLYFMLNEYSNILDTGLNQCAQNSTCNYRKIKVIQVLYVYLRNGKKIIYMRKKQ